MGQFDDEDKMFLIIDKDTGRVYDIRNDMHVEKVTENTTKMNVDTDKSMNKKAWDEWWKQKKRNDQDLLIAAENGDVNEVRRLLDKSKLQDLIADINVKGLDNWSALHFAANEGRINVV